MKEYMIIKRFKPESLLYGMYCTEITTVKFDVGFETDDYIITYVKELAPKEDK